MATNETNYVETDSAKIYATVIGNLMDYCNEALYPGDERRIFGEGLVQVLVGVFSLFEDRAKQRVLRHARGDVLDKIGERLDVYRLQASSAATVFRFSASAARSENIIIPAGSRITTDGSVYFATETAVVLPAGELYVDAPGVCISGGSAYNGLSVGTIGTLVDLIPYIAGVENITVSAGGDDGEPYTEEGDNKLRERIRLAPAKLSTAGSESAYRYLVLSADPDIIDVSIECPKEYPNRVELYPLMRGGQVPDEKTLQKVLQATTGAKVRPMTDHVFAIAPEQVEYAIEIKYYCTKDDEAALIQAIEGEGGAIDQYNEWQTAALNRDIDPDQLRSFIFAAKAQTDATGTVRMDIVRPVLTPVNKSQVAKFSGSLVVSHEVVTV
jgi:phage-related baseplate assembly protein